jgi:hypothetical protein
MAYGVPGLHVHSCTLWLRPRNPPPPPPSPRIWAHIRGRYWTAKIEHISLCPPAYDCAATQIQIRITMHPFSVEIVLHMDENN